MNKNVYFLTGLPRSGGTLLSALLNQNRQIYVSPLSPLPELLLQSKIIYEQNENTIRSDSQKERLGELMTMMTSIYYQNVELPIIFDRSKAWGSPAHLPLIFDYITPCPKIIYTVRSITDIIASFMRLNIKSFEDDYYSGELFIEHYRTKQDGMAEYIMRLNGPMDSALCNLANALNPKNTKYIHFVEYEDLINRPMETMSGIYNFLNIESYNHDFNNIVKVEPDNDLALNMPDNTHEVKKQITISQTNAKQLLSPYIYYKYSNMDFWRKDSLLKIRGKEE